MTIKYVASTVPYVKTPTGWEESPKGMCSRHQIAGATRAEVEAFAKQHAANDHTAVRVYEDDDRGNEVGLVGFQDETARVEWFW